MTDGFRIASAYVQIAASDEGFRAQLAAKIKEAAEGVAAKVKVEADAAGLAEKVRAEAAAADAETHVHVKVDDGTELRSGIERLADDVAPDADRAGARIGESLGSGLFRDANGVLRNASGQFATEAEKLAAGYDTAGNKAKSAGRSAADAGNSFRLSAVGMGSVAAAGISLVPVLAAIPGLAAGAAAGIATLAGAFFGVGKALHDYGAQQNAVGGGGAGGQTAATAYSNAVAIRGAEQAIADAREQSARSTQQSAEQVQAAQQGVVDADRNAATATQNSADQIVAAQQRITQAAYAGQQAQQAYTNAVYNETQAEHALIDAKQLAADQLVDSQNAAKDAHLSTEEAANSASAAEFALNQAKAAGAGPDQLATLDLAARKAVQQLADAKQREKEAVEKANAATKAGVDQAPAVLSAQHAVQMAAESTASAQHGVAQAAQQQSDAEAALAKAQRAAADQQITSDEQVAKARQSLADAQRQADQQREDSAKAVQRAEQNLTDTLKEQALATQSAGASGGAAANKYAEDMKGLSQAGRDFVLTVLSMRGELHQLSQDAQTATLPGFTQMLKDSQHLMPVFEDGVKRTGHALSDMAVAFGHLFANPDFDASAMQFEKIVTGGFGQFTSALPPLLNAIVTEGVRAAPLINSVAAGVHDLVASGLPAFLSGLNVNAGGAAQGVSALLRAVDGLLGPVGTLVGAAAGALGPALDDLEPTFVKIADDVEQSLLPIMPELSKDLVDVAQVVGELFQVLEPIIPLLADELGTALRIIDPLLQDTAGFLHDNQRWLTPVAEGILGVVVALKAWNALSSAAETIGGKITGAFSGLGSSAKKAGEEVEKAGEKTGGGFAGKIGNAIPAVGALATGIIALGTYLQHVYFDGKDASASVDQFTEALLNSEAAASNATLKLDGFARNMQHLGSLTPGVTDSLAQTGLGLAELSQKVGFTSTELKNYDEALAGLVSSGNGDRAASVVAQIAGATDAHGRKLVDVTQALPAYEAAVEKAGIDQLTTARSTDRNKDSTDALGHSLGTTKDKFQAMSDQMQQSEALDRFHAQLLNLKDAADQNGTSLDGNTAKGLANRQAFSDLANQIQAYGKQLKDSGDTNQDAAVHMQDMIGDLEDQGKKFGYSKGQVDAYIKSIGLIPKSVSTDVNWELSVSINHAALEAAGKDIGHVVGHNLVPGNAAGGLVTGPGTGTSDSILRRLSNGEFVVPADATAKLGPAAMESIRNGRIPQVGGTTAQATAPTINLNYYGTQQPTPEQQQIMMRDLALMVRG